LPQAGALGVMPSSVIRAFSYDPDIRTLRIVFLSGRAYLYAGVPEDIYLGLCTAPSKGAFFNTMIRDRFAFSEISPALRRAKP